MNKKFYEAIITSLINFNGDTRQEAVEKLKRSIFDVCFKDSPEKIIDSMVMGAKGQNREFWLCIKQEYEKS